MSEMVERGAIAIHISHYPDCTWAGQWPDIKEECRDDTRTVIAAMRDPTPEMLWAMHEAFSHDCGVLLIWQAGIDATITGKDRGK